MNNKVKKYFELLYFILVDKKIPYSINGPLTTLFINFDEIKMIFIKKNELNNFDIVVSSGLNYDELIKNRILFIKYNNNKSLSFDFFLKTLIQINFDKIEYCYSIDNIRGINSHQKKKPDEFKSNSLIKFSNYLKIHYGGKINNYQNDENKDNEDNAILESIEKESILVIKNSLDDFYDEKRIEKKEKDEKYIENKNELIDKRNFDDSQYIYNLLNLKFKKIIEIKIYDLFKLLNKSKKYTIELIDPSISINYTCFIEINSKNNLKQKTSINNNNIKNKEIKKENNLFEKLNSKSYGFPFQDKKYNFPDESTRMESNLENSSPIRKASIIKIIEFIKIISKFDNAVEYFNELSNSFYIGGGRQNDLTLYDNEYNEKIRIKDLNDWPFKVIEKSKYNEKTKKITLLCCTNKNFKLINLDTQTFQIEKKAYKIRENTFTNCIEMKENNLIIIGHGGASYFIDLFKKNKLDEYKITDKTYRGGMKINDRTAALTSNSIIQSGEDILLLYNIKSKKISQKIEGYSFIVSNNNLALIPREEIKREKKLLLCACKKYKKEQKNGILLVNPDISNYKRIEKEFYETGNFEVYCFCPILNVEFINNGNLNINDEEFKKGIKITDTEYFFVGGFDLDKRIGIIKLFKIIYGEKIWKSKIEYIQDVEIEGNEKFEYFDGPISCINQSKTTGNILISCYDGKIYLFTSPNMTHYL